MSALAQSLRCILFCLFLMELFNFIKCSDNIDDLFSVYREKRLFLAKSAFAAISAVYIHLIIIHLIKISYIQPLCLHYQTMRIDNTITKKHI